VEHATTCLSITSVSGYFDKWLKSHVFAVLAFNMVSAVVKVFELIIKRVSSGSMF